MRAVRISTVPASDPSAPAPWPVLCAATRRPTSIPDVFALVDPRWLDRAVGIDPATIDSAVRHALERTLDLAVWMDLYRPSVRA